MKGIPNQCITYYAEQHKICVLDIYKQLLENQSTEFDLANQNNKCVFRKTQEYNANSLHYGDKGTTRTCQFIRPREQNISIN